MDAKTKNWLKALWAVAIFFLAILFGAGGGCVVGLILPQVSSVRDDYLIGALMLGILGAVVGLPVGIVLTVRVWRWFDKK